MINVLYANDEVGKYPNSYYSSTTKELPVFPQLVGDHKFDICIIGAGYAGLSAALFLRQSGLSVAVLDAHRVGWGASGRNGGQIGSGQRAEQGDLENLVGEDDARKLWDLSQDAKALVRSLINEHDIECEYKPGVLHANHKQSLTSETKHYVDELRSKYHYDEVRYLPQDELRSILATTAYYDGSLDMGAGHLNPLKFAIGLAKACARAGVEIFERSEVGEIQESRPIRLSLNQGQVEAEHVLIAANGYLGDLNKQTADRVIPINNYIIATERLPSELAKSLIVNDAAVADTKFVVNYYRRSVDNRLLFGGRESYRYKFPSDIKSYVRKAMLSVYPQLETTKIDYGWGGTLGITMNRMPHFKWLKPNLMTVGGFSGHGVAIATLAGVLAGEAIRGSASRFDVMARVPTPKVPFGRHARLPILALGMAYYSIRDRLPF